MKRARREIKDIELEGKPDFLDSMNRIEAWYDSEVIDRPPVRFHHQNAEFDQVTVPRLKWRSLKEKWFDTEYQIESFLETIQGKEFLGETFPFFWPNLGPDVYSAFYGETLEYGEVTSWAGHVAADPDTIQTLALDEGNEYFRKLEEMTLAAIEACRGKALVGYSDFHPGLDCVAAWRGVENLCLDLYDDPDRVTTLCRTASKDFQRIYDHFDSMLHENGQISINWMGIPEFGRFHVPSCDVSTMISEKQFDEFELPVLRNETKSMDRNVFHVDGKGVARHIDSILSIPEIDAIQWVQGVGDDLPIMQWLPFIGKLKERNMPVIVDLAPDELDSFMEVTKPEGIFLWIGVDSLDDERTILKKLETWH